MAVTRIADQQFIDNATNVVQLVTSLSANTTGASIVLVTGTILHAAGTNPRLRLAIEGGNDGFNWFNLATLAAITPFSERAFRFPVSGNGTAVNGFAFVRVLFELTSTSATPDQDVEAILTADLNLGI